MLNERLKKRRAECGLTLLEVAEALGVREATVQRYESGNIKNLKHETVVSLAEILKTTPAYLMGWNEHEFSTKFLPLPKTKKIPLLGRIACGNPILAEENITEYIDVDEKHKVDFCLECVGNSMINANINSGDIVYIREQPTVETGQIAAVLIDEEATLKRVYINENQIVLQPENPKYEPLVYIKEEMNSIKILGLVVGFVHWF